MTDKNRTERERELAAERRARQRRSTAHAHRRETQRAQLRHQLVRMAATAGVVTVLGASAVGVAEAAGKLPGGPDRPTIENRLRAQLVVERDRVSQLERKVARLNRQTARFRAQLARARRQASVSAGSSYRTTLASAYGVGFYGRTTACGQTLTANANLVAHKSLSCGTPLIIRSNGRTVATVVGDRGPFVGNRELDLGPGVWRALGFTSEASFGVRSVQVARRAGA